MEEWIKKSDAIKALNTEARKQFRLDDSYAYVIGTLRNVEDAISNIPSADRWIPCSEREPNEFEDVLVLLSDGTMDVLQLTDYLDIWGNVKWCAVHHGLGCAVSGNDVVAWMPLPEPWKGADDDL